MKNQIKILVAMCTFISSGISATQAQDGPLGQFDGRVDVGSPAIAGAASYDAGSQVYTLTGSGINMWSTNDQFSFLWKKMKGDFILRARVEFVGQGVEEHRKIGWMVRESLESTAAYVDGAVHGSGLTSLQFRQVPGTNTAELTMEITNAMVIQFERRGGNYIFSAAPAGEPFVSTNFSDITLPEQVYAGLFICAHNPKVKETAIFRDVRIIRPVKTGFVPYHDFIGSVLEILNVQSGKLETIYESAQPFEAPNWT